MSATKFCEICNGRRKHSKLICDSCYDLQVKLTTLWGNHGERKQTKTANGFAAAVRRKLEQNIRRQA